MRPNFTLNYGLRYDYYVPLQETDNRIVKFNIDTGSIDPDTTPFYKSKKNNFQPRVSATYSLTPKTVLEAGVGIFVGPGQTEDQIQPIEAERISTTVSSGPLHVYPIDPARDPAELHQQPEQPVVSASRLRERLHASREGLSVHRRRCSRRSAAAWRRRWPTSAARAATCSSAASPTGRSACRPTARAAATQVREFDIVTCANGTAATGTLCPGSTIASIQKPYARDRLQDQRRPRQLQRDAARADPPVGERRRPERAVHAGVQQGHHRRLQRSGDGRQQRPRRSPTSTTTTATTTSTFATRST